MTRGSSWIALGVLSAGLLLSLPGTACTGASGALATTDASAAQASAEAQLREIDDRIDRVRAELGADRSKVVVYLSAPSEPGAPPLSKNAEFRALAEHLAQLELELHELEERRTDIEWSEAGGDEERTSGSP